MALALAGLVAAVTTGPDTALQTDRPGRPEERADGRRVDKAPREAAGPTVTTDGEEHAPGGSPQGPDDGAIAGGGNTDTATPLGGTTAPTAPATDGGAVPPAGPRSLGTLLDDGAGTTCLPRAGKCLAFRLECPRLREAAFGEIDIRRASGPPRGVAVFFTEAGGGSWWLEDNPSGEQFLDRLRADGLTIVQVRWKRGSWLFSAPGEVAGTASVACRPATVIRWVHDAVYAPLGLEPASLRCGFCITGNSGGASQVSYALAFYGLDSILDAVIPTGGPPHAALERGCLRNPGDAAFYYEEESAITHVDGSFGFRNGTDGPCARHDATWVPRWRAESVDSGGNDYDHPATRVHVIFGEDDASGAAEHGRSYVDALVRGGSPHVMVEVVAEMGHGFSKQGWPSLRAALLK